MTPTRRDLMTERDKAIAARDWTRMNQLTKQIADLPMAGVKPLTKADVNRYVTGKRRAS